MGRVSVDFREPKMLIGGELVDSVTGDTFESTNPANGEFLADIPRGREKDIDRAVEAAKEGFEIWHSEYTARERAERLMKFAELLRERSEYLGAIDAASSGNPIRQMKDDAMAAAECVEIFAGTALEMKGETIPVSNDTLDYTLRQPYGVVGRIIPYNHPVLFAGVKTASPLIAGNSIVIKPPEQDSESVLELGRMITEEEIFPLGVVNIVPGFGEEAGSPLVKHLDVRKVGFIGSVPTGRTIQKQAAETITDVTLELGGKNPCIVYPDADLEDAVNGAVGGMNFLWCGQSCGSTSRLFLHESHYEEGLELLEDIVSEITPGNPLDPETEMGCLVSKDQYEKVMEYIQLGKESEARLLIGGERPEGEEYDSGNFIEPTVFTDVTMDMRIAREEIFGPVLSVLKWSDEDQLIADANDVKYGLTASIWTDDVATAHRTAKEIEAGYVWVNQAGPHYWGAPFGGWKQSGIGREEAIDEVLAHTQKKNVNVKL